MVLVLLSLAVVLTIVLFVLARSVTDVAVSSRSQEAVRAFSAAEAGIENALVIGTGTNPGSPVKIGDASYTSAVAAFAEGSTDFNYPLPMSSGDSMTTWFVSHDPSTGNLECTDGKCFTGSSIKVCWGKGKLEDYTDANSIPAIEASIFYKVGSETRIGRVATDPNSGRTSSNKFISAGTAGCTIAGVNYAFSQTIDFGTSGLSIPTDHLQFARVRMFYNTETQPLGISVAGGTLPSQGSDIVSTGTAGQSNRKVEVFQGWPEPPAVFDAAVFGAGGLTKSGVGSGSSDTIPTVDSFTATIEGRVITVNYTGISSPTPADWVGIYSPGAANSDLLQTDWVHIRSTGTCTQDLGNGVPSGSCSFTVPADVPQGNYEIRLFTYDSYTQILLKSDNSPAISTLDIPAPSQASISASAADGVVTVNYSGIPAPTTTDWVGIYTSSTDAYNASIALAYVNSTGTCPSTVGGDGKASGSCQFNLPSSVLPGTYEIRLYSNNSSTLLASSSLYVPAPTPTPAPSVEPTPTETPTPTP